MKMEFKQTPDNDQSVPLEIIKQWWPQAYDEFDANPEANCLPIWVVACLLYSPRETTKIREKAEELLYLSQNYRIPCEGNPFESQIEYIINPIFPEVKGKKYISGLFATLSKETVRKHLQQYREWPLVADVPLLKWWEKQHLEKLHERIDINSLTIEQSLGNNDKKKLEFTHAETNSVGSAKDSLINFVKKVLINHPDATTADLRRYCFEDMGDLKPRSRKNVNDLLIKAGAELSKRGIKAKPIKWEDKYLKEQWEQVFKRNK
jgi:hypothetical protein